MGERYGSGRTVRPSGHPGPEPRTADALRAALGRSLPGPEAEARALTAFRDARKQPQDPRPGRIRRRDDWRPRARRRAGRPLPTLLAVLLCGAACGHPVTEARSELP
ncbi:hypothetical protein ACIHAA_19900 [Streptomyces sp. NPDC052040]|uniref:hypothetical protein n=1 Tax=unclassified Streptomyces TaxID=2593676 RepID=UPI0037D2F88B